jgi:sigma-B regulation protein RsbU (phosphoserine phosphatase)
MRWCSGETTGDASGEWDPDRLRQVVANLATNAFKYSAPGTPVTVRTRGEPDYVMLEVHNEGPPIPPEALDHLFEPMQRGKRDDRKEGLGLGLFIVDQIVRAHGGSIEVSSSAEAGTTFRAWLPRHPPPRRVDGTEAGAAAPP